MKKTVKIILLITCLIIFIFSAYKVIDYILQGKKQESLQGELIDKAISEVSINNEQSQEDETNNIVLPISVDFSVLQQENEDIVAWIYSENTPINYPVVQSDDNVFYLRKMINGEYNIAGTIFMDFRNDPNMSDNNTIIYGHNMQNDTMFGTLQDYKKQEYYDEHKIMYLFTSDKQYKIELFAGYTIPVESDIYDMAKLDQEDIEEAMRKSDFKSDVIVSAEDKIITLSTCAYEYEGARYIVMGMLHEVI